MPKKQNSRGLTVKKKGLAGVVARQSLAAGVGSSVAAFFAAGAVAAGVATAVATIISVSIENRASRQRDSLTEFFKQLLEDTTRTPENIGEEFARRISENPDAAEVAVLAIKSVLDGVDASVVPCLARLARLFNDGRVPVDSFYRGTLRMLSDCDAQGLADLRATVAASRLDSGEFPPQTIVTADRDWLGGPLTVANGEKKVGKSITVGSPRSDRLRTTTLDLGTTGEGKRPVKGVTYGRAALVVQRLGTVGIGTPRTETSVESVSVPNAIMERLATILGAETPTT